MFSVSACNTLVTPVTLRCLKGQTGVSGQNVTKIKNFLIKPLIWLQGCQNEIENTGSKYAALSLPAKQCGTLAALHALCLLRRLVASADWELITAMGFFGVGPGLLVASTTDPHLAILVASLVRASGQGWGAQPPGLNFVLGCQT